MPAGRSTDKGAARNHVRLFMRRILASSQSGEKKESYKNGDSDSILALSRAGDIARCRLKRRQGYRWAGLLSFEKRKTRTPTLS